MRRLVILLGLAGLMAGCGGGPGGRPDAPQVRVPDAQTLRPRARPGAGTAAPADARSVAEFDTTTEAERAAARGAAAGGELRLLGTTIASLGNVREPGFWLRTPLVSAPVAGRVVWPAGGGRSLSVQLLPSEAGGGGGSRLSLAAMRELGIGLTALPELQVLAAVPPG